MPDWTLITLAGVLSILLAAWLLIQIFLKGPSLRSYDQPIPNARTGSRDHASPEHQEVLRLLEQAQTEIRTAPRKQWLETVRKVMARGFVEPSLLASHSGYQIRQVDAGGVAGEWVLAPDADPNRRLLYLHGGSFISGCPHGHRVITTQLARITGASVLALDYRLMPEHTRRDLIADCQTGYRWILDHAPEESAPVQELFVAGDSAGGSLALMLIAWARDAGLRAADGAIALSPSVDMTFSSPTLKSHVQSDWMLGPGLGRFMKIPFSIRLLIFWAINRMMPPNPLLSPIFSDLSGLPPVLIQVSEAEMMLGDARRYVNKARIAVTQAKLETWPDMLHVWHLFEPILPEAREALERIGQFVARCSVK